MYHSEETKDSATEIVVSNGKGLDYRFRVHQPVPGRLFNGFSLGDSPIYPLSDIPYVVEALMGIYVTAIDAATAKQAQESPPA